MEPELAADPSRAPGPGLKPVAWRAGTPPLALYVHMPWCLHKCPYCDFNSHAVPGDAAGEPPFGPYVAQLLADLEAELVEPAARRPFLSVFIGGGTPSLAPGVAIASLLAGVRRHAELQADCEITLEANPGAADSARFGAYRQAGVNRLSIGIQSLSVTHLRRLGRVHDPAAARGAVAAARGAGFENLNLDLMFALPGQGLAEAREDLVALIDLGPEHVSYYQLTLEPNTPMHATPPALPDPDLAADLAAQGRELLAAAGYLQYEVSAFARAGGRCRHNLNYWRFGDYLGLGAGAHGKLTDPANGRVRRRTKRRHPSAYLEASPGALVSSERVLSDGDLIFEFALNAFRLTHGFDSSLFESATGLPWSRFAPRVTAALGDGLLRLNGERLSPTTLGRAFVDDLVGRFLPDDDERPGCP